jgi:RNA polymerase sigma factor (sigma-70 family)
MTGAHKLYVVDDDVDMRESIQWLLGSVGMTVLPYGDPAAFLDHVLEEGPEGDCVLLDIRMPGMGGMEVHDWLRRQEVPLPVIFLTGHGDVPLAVRALQSGAFDFIEKPYNAQYLIETVQRALDAGEQERQQRAMRDAIRERLDELTQREWEVSWLVVQGHTNKEIARRLELSPRTVEVHRARAQDKLEAGSTAGLVRMLIAWDPQRAGAAEE